VDVPVTVPYERYSYAAPLVCGACPGRPPGRHGLTKSDIDGLCLSSFTMAPDTLWGLTSIWACRCVWLDHIPMGGAAGIVALRRALRAVQSVTPRSVACVAADTNHSMSFRATPRQASVSCAGCVYPTVRWPQCQPRFSPLTPCVSRRATRNFVSSAFRQRDKCAEIPPRII